MPSFIVKNGPKRQPQNRGRFSCIFESSFSTLSISPCFSLFPAVSSHLGTRQTAHQMRLQAKFYAVNCKLFWQYLRCAVTIFGSETIIFFMLLHLPYFFWDSFQHAFAAFKMIGINYFMQLQFWKFSELILNKFWGGESARKSLKIPKNVRKTETLDFLGDGETTIKTQIEARTRRSCTGVKIPKTGKRGFGVEKPPCPTNPEKGSLSQKIPFLPVLL